MHGQTTPAVAGATHDCWNPAWIQLSKHPSAAPLALGASSSFGDHCGSCHGPSCCVHMLSQASSVAPGPSPPLPPSFREAGRCHFTARAQPEGERGEKHQEEGLKEGVPPEGSFPAQSSKAAREGAWTQLLLCSSVLGLGSCPHSDTHCSLPCWQTQTPCGGCPGAGPGLAPIGIWEFDPCSEQRPLPQPWQRVPVTQPGLAQNANRQHPRPLAALSFLSVSPFALLTYPAVCSVCAGDSSSSLCDLRGSLQYLRVPPPSITHCTTGNAALALCLADHYSHCNLFFFLVCICPELLSFYSVLLVDLYLGGKKNK